MINFKKIVSAIALVAVASTSAMAQTDFGSPIGAGAGVGGTIAPFLPGARGGARNARALARANARPMPAGIANRISGVRGVLTNSPTNGVRVVSPAGGTVILSQSISQALGAVLGGAPTAGQTSTLTGAGVPSALATALQAYGTSPTRGAHSAAVTAYNAAVGAIPEGQAIPPALLAVRAALAGAVGRANHR